MKKPEFKIGNRVVYIYNKDSFTKEFVGKIGTVKNLIDEGTANFQLEVHFDGNSEVTGGLFAWKFRKATKLTQALQ